VWPDLDPVRPFIIDSKAEAVNTTRAATVKVGREALQAMLNKELGTDDCRHAFLTSQTFMPGVENFLCPCGALIGFDFLDRAESPAHVLASLMQRFPLLSSVVYFDTACQMARNASRRVPWLVNMSAMASSIDRAHRLQKQHGCCPVFDADAYPGRSVRHRTACAESRRSINKAFKSHLVHLRQDHFIVQMRLLGAFVNLRVSMRRELGRETNHRLACDFFHTHVQSYCDRRSCTCAHGRRQQAEDAAAAAANAAAAAPAAPAFAGPAPAAGIALANAADADDRAAVGATVGRRGHVLDRPAIGQAALQAALRGALRAAGVIPKVENAPGADCEQVGCLGGDGGDVVVRQDGGDGGDGLGGAGESGSASAGARVGVHQVDGLDVPCVDTDDSSVDGLSSYSAGSDDEPGNDSD